MGKEKTRATPTDTVSVAFSSWERSRRQLLEEKDNEEGKGAKFILLWVSKESSERADSRETNASELWEGGTIEFHRQRLVGGELEG